MCISPKRMMIHGEFVDVPCGKCRECIVKRKSQWEIRLLSEMSGSDRAFFSLISYDEENLPDPMVAEYKELNLLVKRLRSCLSRNQDLLDVLQDSIDYCSRSFSALTPQAIRRVKCPSVVHGKISLKYFIVSEYGEMRNRLHYHAIFFLSGPGAKVFTFPLWKCLLEYQWKKGFCSAFTLDPHWITYACKYIQKQYNFMMHSRLGKEQWLADMKGWNPADEYELPFYPVKGKLRLPPKNWCKELMGDQRYNIGVKRFINSCPDTGNYERRFLLNEKFVLDNPELFQQRTRQLYDEEYCYRSGDDFNVDIYDMPDPLPDPTYEQLDFDF